MFKVIISLQVSGKSNNLTVIISFLHVSPETQSCLCLVLVGHVDKSGAEITLKISLKTPTKSCSLSVFNHLPCSDLFGNGHFCHDGLLMPVPSSHFGGTCLPYFGFAICFYGGVGYWDQPEGFLIQMSGFPWCFQKMLGMVLHCGFLVLESRGARSLLWIIGEVELVKMACGIGEFLMKPLVERGQMVVGDKWQVCGGIQGDGVGSAGRSQWFWAVGILCPECSHRTPKYPIAPLSSSGSPSGWWLCLVVMFMNMQDVLVL